LLDVRQQRLNQQANRGCFILRLCRLVLNVSGGCSSDSPLFGEWDRIFSVPTGEKKMTLNTLYAISCPLLDEKKLVKALDTAFDRKLSLSKSESLLKGRRPQVLDHIWFNMQKADGLYIELRHNRDTVGNLELPDYADHPLILFARINEAYAVANGADPREVQSFVASCVSRLPYKVLLVGHPE
jgi:hypothetical protein